MKNQFDGAAGSARWIAAMGMAAAVAISISACEVDDSEPVGPDEGGESSGEGDSSPLEISGTWTSAFGSTETIGDLTWSAAYPTDDGTDPVVIEEAVVQFDNAANFAIVQAPADDAFNPSKYSKKVWTDLSGGSFYYCQVSFGLDSIAEAVATDNAADPTDLDGQGCQGFPWTQLSAAGSGGS